MTKPLIKMMGVRGIAAPVLSPPSPALEDVAAVAASAAASTSSTWLLVSGGPLSMDMAFNSTRNPVAQKAMKVGLFPTFELLVTSLGRMEDEGCGFGLLGDVKIPSGTRQEKKM